MIVMYGEEVVLRWCCGRLGDDRAGGAGGGDDDAGQMVM
jgi:hypothetical protein